MCSQAHVQRRGPSQTLNSLGDAGAEPAPRPWLMTATSAPPSITGLKALPARGGDAENNLVEVRRGDEGALLRPCGEGRSSCARLPPLLPRDGEEGGLKEAAGGGLLADVARLEGLRAEACGEVLLLLEASGDAQRADAALVRDELLVGREGCGEVLACSCCCTCCLVNHVETWGCCHAPESLGCDEFSTNQRCMESSAAPVPPPPPPVLPGRDDAPTAGEAGWCSLAGMSFIARELRCCGISATPCTSRGSKVRASSRQARERASAVSAYVTWWAKARGWGESKEMNMRALTAKNM